MIKRIHVDDIRPGMFIKKVESDWLSSPWLVNNRMVESDDDIARIKGYDIEYVQIDTERSAPIRAVDEAPAAPTQRGLHVDDAYAVALAHFPVGCSMPVNLYIAQGLALELIFKAGLVYNDEVDAQLRDRADDGMVYVLKKEREALDRMLASVEYQRMSGFEGRFLDPERTEAYFAFMKNYFAINPLTLAPGVAVPFDIFVRLGEEMTRVVGRGENIPSHSMDTWINTDVNLLIRRTACPGYREYLKSLVHAKDQRVRAAVVRENSRMILESFAADPKNIKLLGDTKESVTDLASAVMDNPTSFYGLMKINNHDYYTFTHSVNVATLAIALALSAGVADKEALMNLGLGALLHDVGKSRVDPTLINKPGRLTDEEYVEVKRHVDYGDQILDDAPLSEEARIPLRQHHEKLNGKGYPYGLKRKEIHLFGRIASIIDVYDALTTERSYKKAMEPFDALALIYKGVGEEFDPTLFRSFVQILQRQKV
jgi:putative nucleotidyltransferase with HDIG domain